MSSTSGNKDTILDKESILNIETAKNNGILRMFIGLVQNKNEEKLEECSEEDCVALLNWLHSEKIDVNKPAWHFDEYEQLIPQLFVDESSEKYNLSLWAQKLCYMLTNLLKCKGDMQYTDEDGKSILHILIESSFFQMYEIPLEDEKVQQMVEYLMDKGISVNEADKNGDTPVHLATEFEKMDLVKIMLKNYVNINVCNKDGDTVLHIIVNRSFFKIEFIEVVELLIAQGADVNLKNKVGRTPLHLAIRRNNSILRILVQAGADINAQDRDDVTPLHLAALTAPLDTLKYLVKKGGNVSRRERIFGFTVLHMAAFRNNTFEIDRLTFEFLLQQTSNVNESGNYGITALHLASFQGHLEFVQILIAHGADVHCRDNKMHSTALHFFARRGIITDYINHITGVEHNPNWNTLFLKKYDCKSLVALLLKHGLDINVKDIRGRTPLHVATEYLEDTTSKDVMDGTFFSAGMVCCCVNILLEYGAHVDAQDNEGNIPLHNALKTEHILTLKNLLEFGVDLNEEDTSRIVLNCKEDTKKKVLLHFKKLQIAELPVSSTYSSILKTQMNTEDFQSYYSRCEKEVNNMKAAFIDNDTSIYDFFHMGWRKRLVYKEKIPSDVEKKFPLYGGIILGSCWEAEQRKHLMEPAMSAWYQITQVDLPEICVERILDFLKNRYLRVLANGIANDDK